MGGDEIKLVQAAFESNWIAPIGPCLDQFEKQVADYLGLPAAVGLTSGTAAIHLALRAVGVGAGDEVFCSSLTFVGSTNPILYLGAQPVFIDSDWATWNMSPAALAVALEEAHRRGKTPKAIIVVNLYGQSADLDPILALADKFEIAVIEDAAESLGATYKQKRSGSFGAMSILSFNGNKIITTSNGGMLLSSNPKFVEKARFWATQARDPVIHYQHSEMGYNYRLSNLLAAVGIGQMNVLESRVEARRAIFTRYQEAFRAVEGLRFMPEADFGRSNRWLTTLTVDPKKTGTTSSEIIEALTRENIESRPVWKPLHRQPLYEKNRYYPLSSDESVSDFVFNFGLCLPSGSALSLAQQQRVIDIIFKAIKFN
jgi:pyridoxal phosphate-dependent aminotransferase EpsN